MLTFPLADPGTPDLRSPATFLWRIAVMQRKMLASAIAAGIVWMSCSAVTPFLLGRAIDRGLVRKDSGELTLYVALIVAVAAIQAITGMIRHRFAVQTWLGGALRTQQWLTRQSAALGATLPKKLATGEVVAVSSADIYHVGNAFDVLGRTAGSIFAFFVVSVILLDASQTLGLIVLIGVPALTLLVGPIVIPLHRRQMRLREQTGRLTSIAADTVAGLRVLRGIGGEGEFLARYKEQSQRVKSRGIDVWRLQSVLDAIQIGVPAIFIVIVTWLGARMAINGEIAVGELVAFYSYSAFLVIPLRTITETINKLARANVASKRIIRVLEITSDVEDSGTTPLPAPGAVLRDQATGIEIPVGTLTAIVSVEPSEGVELAHRLTRFADGEVTWGGIEIHNFPLIEYRKRVLLHDHDPRIFSGTLRTVLDPHNRHSDSEIIAALAAASGDDILEAVADGLDTAVEERGRSLSGGQRQRLSLARTLLLNPEIAVMDEPTSAVDAHTEARIADSLHEYRAGRTTVVLTSSPLLLDRADAIIFLDQGRVIATGKHHDLLRTTPEYRMAVTREEVEA